MFKQLVNRLWRRRHDTPRTKVTGSIVTSFTLGSDLYQLESIDLQGQDSYTECVVTWKKRAWIK